MHEIEFFKLSITPLYLCNRPEKELRIKLTVNGIEHSYRRILHPEDLLSHYDQLFEMAKTILKETIDKYK